MKFPQNFIYKFKHLFFIYELKDQTILYIVI